MNYRGRMKKSTLHYYVTLFSQNNVFISTFYSLHKEYSKTYFYDKIKYLSTDTTFIINKSSLLSNVNRNPYMKNKNCIKISCLADVNGVPLDIFIRKGNLNDSPMLREHFDSLKINLNLEKTKNSNRYKPYFLADGIYNSSKNINFLKDKGFTPIIASNSHTEPLPMTNKEKIIYKKRIIIENYFANIKQFRRLAFLYDKTIKTYLSFVHLGSALLLFKKINVTFV